MVTEREPRRFDDDDEDEQKPLEPPWQTWLKRAVPVVIPILLVIVILNVWMLPNYVKKEEDIVNFQNVLATIDTLKSKIDELSDGSNELNSLRTQVNQLSDKVVEFDETINKIDLSKYVLKDSVPSNVSSEIATLKTQISSLQSKVDNLNIPGVDSIKSDISTLKTTVDSLKTSIDTLKTQYTSLIERISDLEDSFAASNPDMSNIDIEFMPTSTFVLSDNKTATTQILVMITNNNEVDVSLNEVIINFDAFYLEYPNPSISVLDGARLSHRSTSRSWWYNYPVSNFVMNIDRTIKAGKSIAEYLTFNVYDNDEGLTVSYVQQMYLDDPDITVVSYSFN